MGFNDFHKGFRNTNETIKPAKFVMKQKFGVRSVEEVIQSRYMHKPAEVQEKTPQVMPERTTGVDYQRTASVQRSLRNLDK